jgi:hypothetical protein
MSFWTLILIALKFGAALAVVVVGLVVGSALAAIAGYLIFFALPSALGGDEP